MRRFENSHTTSQSDAMRSPFSIAWVQSLAISFGLFLLFPTNPLLFSDEMPKEKPVSTSQLEAWLRDLDGTVYKQRQQAFLGLWQAGKEADGLLEKLSQTPNASSKAVANWLLLLRRLGTSPSDAGESLLNLSLVRSGDFYTLVRLARNRQWGQVLVLLELLSDEQRAELLEDSANRQILLTMALEEGESFLFPALVDRLYTPIEARAARELWKEFGHTFEEKEPLAAQDPVAQTLKLEWSGKVDEAIVQATGYSNLKLADFIRLRNFRWNDLRRQPAKVLPSESIRNIDQLRDAVTQALYCQWSGDEENSNRWKEAIRGVSPKAFDPQDYACAQVAIGLHREGLRAWEKTASVRAFRSFRALGDLNEVFRLAGLTEITPDGITQWLTTKKLLINAGLDRSHQDFVFAAELGSLLHRLGKEEEAGLIDDALIGLAENNPTSCAELLQTWINHNRQDKAMDFLAKFLERMGNDRTFARELSSDADAMIDWVFNDFRGVGRVMLFELKSRSPKQSWAESLKKLDQLHHGVLPEELSLPGDFESFARRVDSREGYNGIVMGTLAKKLGYYQLAVELFGRTSGIEAALKQVEVMEDLGWLDLALQSLERIVDINEDARMLGHDFRLQLLRSKLLRQVGRREEADQVRRQALCIPMDVQSYIASFDEMKKAGFEQEATRLRHYAWKTAGPDDDALEFIGQSALASEREKDPVIVSEWARVLQIRSLLKVRRSGSSPDWQIQCQSIEMENEALRWADLGDETKADRYVQKALAIRPDNINFIIRLYPLAKEKFGKETAERWFEFYFEHHRRHLEQWPRDAMFHNNLAWLSAKCETHLSDALDHSKTACELRPNDPTYMDTLAEVEFCLGNIERAIELELACLKIDPTDQHNKDQLSRFQAAKKATLNPEGSR